LRYPAHKQTDRQTKKQAQRGGTITSFTFGGRSNEQKSKGQNKTNYDLTIFITIAVAVPGGFQTGGVGDFSLGRESGNKHG